MNTKLLYLDDTYRITSQAIAQELGRDEKGTFLVFDQTVFYPQGGGQQADRGVIIDEAVKVPVIFVSFRDGRVLHYIPETFLDRIVLNQRYDLEIDLVYRLDNARLHTGGHLISHIIETLEPKLVPIKGYHFREGAYVEFRNPSQVDASRLLGATNQDLREVLLVGADVTAAYSDFNTIKRMRPELTPLIPLDKPTRIVSIGNYTPLPCGGTHVASLSQIGTVNVTKTKRVKDNVRMSYEVLDPEWLNRRRDADISLSIRS